MSPKILPLAVLAFCIPTLSAWAQSAEGNAAPPNRPTQNERGACWQKAGISEATMEQARTIERDAHAQVNGVRDNVSLGPRQKQFQMREIRMRAKSKMDALMTPEQQNSLHACQQERREMRPQN
jgi:Spy/CpxP family protein refolding chaperone